MDGWVWFTIFANASWTAKTAEPYKTAARKCLEMGGWRAPFRDTWQDFGRARFFSVFGADGSKTAGQGMAPSAAMMVDLPKLEALEVVGPALGGVDDAAVEVDRSASPEVGIVDDDQSAYPRIAC